MTLEEFIELSIKYVTNSITAKELDRFNTYIENVEYNNIFKSYIETNYITDQSLKNFNVDEAKQELIEFIRKENLVTKKRRFAYVKYVAAIVGVGLMVSGYFFKDSLYKNSIDNVPTVVVSDIEAGTNKAVLTLGSGAQVVLEKGTSYQNKNVNSNGEQIIYNKNSKKEKQSEIEYHYLTIPRGGEYFIKLSDGTQVWINSESQLKYPTSFTNEETRKIELVYGEAYFDVSPSSLNKGTKFIVQTQGQDIEVLGTEFNVKAYKDESNIYATLVEGEVTIKVGDKKRNLTPSQQSILNKTANTLEVITIDDVYNEISWKEGVFSFEEKPLIEIMKVLSRWYNMEVVFENESIKNVKFIGVIGKDQRVEEILSDIKDYEIIKEFIINEKTVILK